MEHGRYTAVLGRRLKKRIGESDVDGLGVYFDHGSKGESKKVVPYFGRYGTSTTLAFVDLAIVNEHSGSALVLCEVEEEGANPKKIIGDCFNIFLSDFVCIGRRPYDARHSHFFVGIVVESKGNAADKACGIKSRIQACIRKEARKGIELEFITDPDPESLLDRLEDRICGLVGVRD